MEAGDGEDMRKAAVAKMLVDVGGEFRTFTESHGDDWSEFGLFDA